MALSKQDVTITFTVNSKGAITATDKLTGEMIDLKDAAKDAGKSVDQLENEFKGTTAAINASLGGMKNAGSALERIGVNAVTLNQGLELAAKGFNLISGAVKSTVGAYLEQERVEKNLQDALRRTGQEIQGNFRSFVDFAGAIQDTTGVGDELTLRLAAIALSAGRTVEETQKLITASTNLAGALGRDVESSFNQLLKTFGGFAGELGETDKAFKSFTAEQLQAGAAIDFANEKFANANTALRTGLRGALDDVTGRFGDFLQAVGEVVVKTFDLERVFQQVASALKEAESVVNAFAESIEGVKFDEAASQVKTFGAALGVASIAAGAVATALFPIIGTIAALTAGVAGLTIALDLVIRNFENFGKIFDLVIRQAIARWKGFLSSLFGTDEEVAKLKAEVVDLGNQIKETFDTGLLGTVADIATGINNTFVKLTAKAADNEEITVDTADELERQGRAIDNNNDGLNLQGTRVNEILGTFRNITNQLADQRTQRELQLRGLREQADFLNQERQAAISAIEEELKLVGELNKERIDGIAQARKDAEALAELDRKRVGSELAQRGPSFTDDELDTIREAIGLAEEYKQELEEAALAIRQQSEDFELFQTNEAINQLSALRDKASSELAQLREEFKLDDAALKPFIGAIEELDTAIGILLEKQRAFGDPTPFEKATEALKENFGTEVIIEDLGAGFQNLIDKINASPVEPKFDLRPALQSLRDFFGQYQLEIPVLLNPIGDVLGDLGTFFDEGLKAGASSLTGLTDMISGFFGGFTAFIDAASQMISTITGLINAVPDLIDQLAGLVNLIVDFPKILRTAFDGLFDAFINLAENFLANIVTDLPKIVDRFIEFLIKTLPKIIEQLALLGPALIDVAINVIPRLVQALVTNLVQQLPVIAVAMIRALIANLGQLFRAMFLLIPQIGMAIAVGIVEGLIAIGDLIGELISDAISGDLFKSPSEQFKKTIEEGTALVLESIGGSSSNIFQAIEGEGQKQATAQAVAIDNAFNRGLSRSEKIFKGLWDLLLATAKLAALQFVLVWEQLKIAGAVVVIAIQSVIEIWKSVGEFIVSLFTASWELWKSIAEAIIELFKGLWDAFGEIFSGVGEIFKGIIRGLQAVFTFFFEVWDDPIKAFSNLLEGLKEAGKMILLGFEKIGDGIAMIVIAIGDFFADIGSAFVEAAGKAWEATKTLFINLGDIFADAAGRIWEKVKEGFSNFGQFLANAIQQALNGLGNIISGIFDVEIDFKGKGPVEKFLGIDFPWLNFAEGGTVPGNAPVSGDSQKNDLIPALLSPGEIVIPRSMTQDKALMAVLSEKFAGRDVPMLSGGLFGENTILGKVERGDFSGATEQAANDVSGAVDSIGNALSSLADNVKAAYESITSLGASVDLSKLITDPVGAIADAVNSIIGGLMRPVVQGALKMQQGGLVTGSGIGDVVPAMLTPGEFVMSAGAVNRIGSRNLDALNSGGGSVSNNQSVEVNLTINTTQPIDQKFVKAQMMPIIKEELRKSSLNGERILSPRGVRA